MNAYGYYLEEQEEEQTAPERITIAPAVLATIARSPKPAPQTPEPPAREQVLDAVAVEVTPEPAPEPPVVSEFPESDRCRKWFAALDLETIPDEEKTTAEFYKYSVSVYNAGPNRVSRYYLFTRSPQQKSWRHSAGTPEARGNTKEELHDGLERFLAQRERKETARRERVAKNRAARAEFKNPYKVGDILSGSWGYDQTNVDYFQVLEVRPTSIKISKIACSSTGAAGVDCDHVIPARDNFLDRHQNIWVTIQIDARYGHSVPSPVHGGLSLWDGKPDYRSWYH